MITIASHRSHHKMNGIMQKISLPPVSRMLQPDFIYGVATSSFQIEGARDSRLPCIWDTFCQQPGAIADNSNGDIACEHVARWQQDVELIASLGVDAYRLSIAWPRVMHQDGSLNEDGLNFYVQLIDALTVKGIKVFVTFYHWDLPQYLEDQGGWLNRQTAYAFRDYVEAVAKVLGDKVYSYATLNEPFCSGYLGYEIGVHAPGLTGRKNGRQAIHNLLLAHGLAMQVLREHCPSSQNGIVLNFSTSYPLDDSPENQRAARIADEYMNWWYLHPLLNGCYPPVMDLLAEDERPDIEDGDMQIIAASLDYLGINFYTRHIFKATDDGWFEQVMPENVPLTDMGWEIYPQSFTDLLVQLKREYPNLPPIYITENGAAMPDKLVDGMVNDEDRIGYFHGHLNAVHAAIEQGVRVDGYFAWSLMDNFEWALGYEKRFGIVYVDYQTQQRTIKNSGLALRDLFSSRANAR